MNQKQFFFSTIIVLLMTTLFANSVMGQQSWIEVQAKGKGTLTVYVQEEYPFAFYQNNELVGIEIDILNQFVKWVELRYGVSLEIAMTTEHEFFKVYDAVRQQENILGAASITITKERKNEVDFTTPYLRNKSVLVSSLNYPTLTRYNDFPNYFEAATAVVIRETTHEDELMEIKTLHFPEMQVKYVWATDELHDALKTNADYFTMVDLLTFWSWVRNGDMGMKIHRIATAEKEQFAFAVSPGSDWKPVMDEFLNGGFGFSSTEDYLEILSSYLSEEVISEVKN